MKFLTIFVKNLYYFQIKFVLIEQILGISPILVQKAYSETGASSLSVLLLAGGVCPPQWLCRPCKKSCGLPWQRLRNILDCLRKRMFSMYAILSRFMVMRCVSANVSARLSLPVNSCAYPPFMLARKIASNYTQNLPVTVTGKLHKIKFYTFTRYTLRKPITSAS